MSASFVTVRDDYRIAIERLGTISSRTCREKAMREYHYHLMAKGFVREYEAEIAQPSGEEPGPNLAAAFSPPKRESLFGAGH